MVDGIAAAVAPTSPSVEIPNRNVSIGDKNNNINNNINNKNNSNNSNNKMDNIIHVAADDQVINVVGMDDKKDVKQIEKDEKPTPNPPAYINPTFESSEEHLPPGTELRVIPLDPERPDTSLSVVRPVVVDPVSTNVNKYAYGMRCCASDAMQVLNRPIVFVICLCMGVIAQGLTVSGISLASLTGIEKQFGLKSAEVALFITVYDTAYGICSLFVGYIGTNHKPRYLGFGLLIMVCGAVLVTIPKFKIGAYEAGHEQVDDFCHNSTNYSTKKPGCDDQAAADWIYQLIFNIGYLILGFGATPLYTLGPAHIDDVTERGTSSLYLGILYAASAIGPAFGFIISTPLLEEWVEMPDDPPLFAKPTDQQWVGAWWVGFLIGAGLLLIPVIPMLGFSRIFPDTEQLRAKKLELVDTVAENRELRMAWPAVKALFKNGPYMCISMAIAAEALAIGGFSTFIPKYIEEQYNITSAKAALYTGLMGIPSAAGGVLLGGYLIKKFEWNCKQILKRVTIMGFFSTIFCAFLLAPCDPNEIIKPATSMTFDAVACNITCNCNQRYNPICLVETQKTYFSPCYAGCFKSNENNDEDEDDKDYINCACFPSQLGRATSGQCRPESCPLFPIFVVGIFLLVVASFLSNVPMITATFRVVNEGQGSFAMGFQQIFVRFLGFIPSPVMYGALIDRSCKLWQPSDDCNKDDTKRNCLEYYNDDFRYYMTILAAVCKLIAFMFMFLAYKLYKLPPVNRTSPDAEEVGVDNVTMDTESTTTPTPPEQGL